ncbi:MAG: SUMF1/EgtB/PvdO family nonheme iron enzyme, partial [Propionibacterium sp.]|nr:SUMF1/EgtB/PvdO family nonheme iron enzyme [Propionibacterium sp.]
TRPEHQRLLGRSRDRHRAGFMTASGHFRGRHWAVSRGRRHNSLDDGYLTTAPARHFTPNGYGLFQTVGNVWEWCQDWYDPGYYRHSPVAAPEGPATGRQRVLRGGSFLCHDSYCTRYRNSARSQNTPDSAMSNSGFRTVAIDDPREDSR